MEPAPAPVKLERKDKKSEKKAAPEKEKKKKRDKPKVEPLFNLEEPVVQQESLAEKLGALAPMMMAVGGAIAYTRFPIVQSFVNSAVGQLMQSLTVPDGSAAPSSQLDLPVVRSPPANS